MTGSCTDYAMQLGEDESGVTGKTGDDAAKKSGTAGAKNNADDVDTSTKKPADDSTSKDTSSKDTSSKDSTSEDTKQGKANDKATGDIKTVAPDAGSADAGGPERYGLPPPEYCTEGQNVQLPEELREYWDTFCEHECGDGILEGAEQCDDANLTSGDGCSADCVIEAGYECPTAGQPCIEVPLPEGIDPEDLQRYGRPPSDYCTAGDGVQLPEELREFWDQFCEHECGDGILEGSEQCDDFNLASGDGCSDSCIIEAGYECPAAGQPCVVVPLPEGVNLDDLERYGRPPPEYCTEGDDLPLPDELRAFWDTFCVE